MSKVHITAALNRASRKRQEGGDDESSEETSMARARSQKGGGDPVLVPSIGWLRTAEDECAQDTQGFADMQTEVPDLSSFRIFYYLQGQEMGSCFGFE